MMAAGPCWRSEWHTFVVKTCEQVCMNSGLYIITAVSLQSVHHKHGTPQCCSSQLTLRSKCGLSRSATPSVVVGCLACVCLRPEAISALTCSGRKRTFVRLCVWIKRSGLQFIRACFIESCIRLGTQADSYKFNIHMLPAYERHIAASCKSSILYKHGSHVDMTEYNWYRGAGEGGGGGIGREAG